MAEAQFTDNCSSPITYAELIAAGKTPEQATKILNERVFGTGHQVNAKGVPVEQGRGSPSNETSQHKEALRISLERKAQAQPNNADVIAAAVAAGVKAGLAAAREETL